MKTIEKVCGTVEKALLYACIALLIAVTVLTFAETVLRYVFNSSLKITQELVTCSMPWLAFVGGAVAWRRGSLVNIDALGKAPAWLQSACVVASNLLIAGLLYLCIRSGITYTLRNVAQLSPSMRVSVSWCYASIPVGSAFMLLFSVEKLLKIFFPGKGAGKEEAS